MAAEDHSSCDSFDHMAPWSRMKEASGMGMSALDRYREQLLVIFRERETILTEVSGLEKQQHSAAAPATSCSHLQFPAHNCAR